jgi:hypothetical protein
MKKLQRVRDNERIQLSPAETSERLLARINHQLGARVFSAHYRDNDRDLTAFD